MIRRIISKIKLSQKRRSSKLIKFSSRNSDVRVKEAAFYVGKNFHRALVKLSEK